MRTKLAELISTMEQYNGMLKNDKEYVGGAKVEIETDIPDMPDHGTITESQTNRIKSLLLTESKVNTHQNKLRYFGDENRYVMTYDVFLKEGFQKRPPQDPNYDDRPRGWNDNDDDDEEEE